MNLCQNMAWVLFIIPNKYYSVNDNRIKNNDDRSK